MREKVEGTPFISNQSEIKGWHSLLHFYLRNSGQPLQNSMKAVRLGSFFFLSFDYQ